MIGAKRRPKTANKVSNFTFAKQKLHCEPPCKPQKERIFFIAVRNFTCKANFTDYARRKVSHKHSPSKKKAAAKATAFFDYRIVDQYIPSMPPPAGAMGAGGSGMSATSDSVVRRVAATEAAFWRAVLVTLVGSRMPFCTRSQYSSFKAS